MTRGRLLGTCWEGEIHRYVYVQFTIVCYGGHLICAVCRAASGIFFQTFCNGITKSLGKKLNYRRRKERYASRTNIIHCHKSRPIFRDIPRSVDARSLYRRKNS